MCLAAFGTAQAATINVTPAGAIDTSNNGNCSLIEAVQAANGDVAVDNCTAGNGADTLVLPADSQFTLIAPFVVSSSGDTGLPEIASTITLQGNSSAIVRTSLNFAPLFRVLSVTGSGNLTLNDVTISRGEVEHDGGAIRVAFGGVLTLVECAVVGNEAIGNGGSSGTVGSGYGGAIVNQGGRVSIFSSTLSGNTSASDGGAIAVLGNTATDFIESSTLSGNVAGGRGGAIASPAGSGFGGGAVEIFSSTITDNAATSFQRGVFTSGDTILVSRSIISGNTGGGPGLLDVGASPGTDPFESGGDNLIGAADQDAEGQFTASGDMVGVLDPMLGALADNGGPTRTHLPLAASSAVEAVTAFCPASLVDQRGASRPEDGDVDGVARCDIGSVELAADFTDSDGDGIPDAYEDARGLNSSVDDANDDLDGDGVSNLNEYNTGSDVGNPDTDGDSLGDAIDDFPNTPSNQCTPDGLGDADFDVTARAGVISQCAAENSIRVRASAIIEANSVLRLYAPNVSFELGTAVPQSARVQVIAADPTPP